MKFFVCDWRPELHCQLRNGLAEVAVVVDNLIQSEPLQQQLIAVTDSAHFDSDSERRGRSYRNSGCVIGFTVGTLFAEYFGELRQKYGDAMVEVSFRCARRLPLSDFHSASGDDVLTV